MTKIEAEAFVYALLLRDRSLIFMLRASPRMIDLERDVLDHNATKIIGRRLDAAEMDLVHNALLGMKL